MTTAAITGHRPERILNMELVADELARAYDYLGITYVIQGLAAGVDLKSAEVAFGLDIPYAGAKPWAGHKARVADRELYKLVEDNADRMYIVNDSVAYPGPKCYQDRNEFMVDKGQVVIAVWDGESKGGTWNAIEYALKCTRPVWCIDPQGDSDSCWYAESV